MPKVKFSQTRIVKDRRQTKFEAGKIYELTEASCRHWINRAVAAMVTSGRVSQPVDLSPEDDDAPDEPEVVAPSGGPSGPNALTSADLKPDK